MDNLSAAERIAESQARKTAGLDDEPPGQCPHCSEEAMKITDQGTRGHYWWCYAKCSNCGHRENNDNFDNEL